MGYMGKITTERLPLEVSRVYINEFQKDFTLTAELKQTVISTVTYPPKKSVSHSRQDNPFDLSLFNPSLYEEKVFSRSKVYVAFIEVPLEFDTVEKVREYFKKYPNAIVYKVLSNYPILTEEQDFSLTATEDALLRQEKLDIIANRQLFARRGMIVLDPNGKPQFIATYLSLEFREDEDLRTKSFDDYYKNRKVRVLLDLAKFNGFKSIKI